MPPQPMSRMIPPANPAPIAAEARWGGGLGDPPPADEQDDPAGEPGADRRGGPVEALVDALHDGRLGRDRPGGRVGRRGPRARHGGGEGEDGEADQDQAGDAVRDLHDGLLSRRSGGLTPTTLSQGGRRRVYSWSTNDSTGV